MLIEFDNTVALVKTESEGELEVYCQVRDAIKCDAPGARYMYQHKLWLRTRGRSGWDGKTSILSRPGPRNGTSHFPTGLLPMVYQRLTGLISPSHIRLNDLRIKPNVTIGQYTVPLRDYQHECFLKATKNVVTMGGLNRPYDWPCGVIQVATGGGKTEIAIAIYQAIPVPTMFIAHRKHLVTQARERFKFYGVETGQIGDGKFDPNPTGVTVATVQTIDKIFKDGDTDKIKQFANAKQIFFDEAHLAASKIDKGNQLVLLSRQFRSAYYRWGLTATPFMKDQYSNQLLMGCTGDKLCQISNAQLIQSGHLTPPRVVIIKMDSVKGPKMWPEVYDSAIILNEVRNRRIIEELIDCPKPAFVMTTRLGHAKVLRNLAESLGFSLPAVVCGDTSNKDRTQVIKDLQSGKEKAIIATTIFDEGVDLPELRTLIFAGGGKSTVAQLQRIGRGLRTSAGKHEILVIDFNDTSGAILKRHSAARHKVWVDEGFTIEEKE